MAEKPNPVIENPSAQDENLRQLQNEISNIYSQSGNADKVNSMNQNVRGNYATGPNPSLEKISINDYLSQADTWARDENAFGKTFDYGADWKHANFERYYAHPKFKELGFSPYRNNEAEYNQKSSWADEYVRSLPGVFTQWGTGFGSNDEDAINMEKSNAVYGSTKGGLGGGLVNLSLNAAYTGGLLTRMVTEEIVLAVATVATEGLDIEITGPAAAMSFAKFGRGVGKVVEAMKGTKYALANLKDLSKAKQFFAASTTGAERMGMIGRGLGKTFAPNMTEFVVNAYEGTKAYKDLGQYTKMVKGFGSFYKDVREVTLAYSEAQLEGAMARNKINEDLTNDYFAKNGKMAEGQDAEDIYQKGKSTEASVKLWNSLLIYGSNKIVFAKIFKGFPSAAGIRQSVSESGKDLFERTGRTLATETAFQKMQRSFAEKSYDAIFSSSISPLSKRYFLGNLTEALQENAQDVLSEGYINYYKEIYKHPSQAENIKALDMLGIAAGKQFSKEGFETFLSGYAMGFMIQAPQHVLTVGAPKAIYKIAMPEQYAKLRAEKEQQENDILNSINHLVKDTRSFDGTYADQLAKNSLVSQRIKDAEEKGDTQGAENAKEELWFDHTNRVFRTGSTAYVKDYAKSQLEMDDNDLVNSVEGAKMEDAPAIRKSITRAIERMDVLEKGYNRLNAIYGNPFNPNNFNPQKEPQEWMQEKIHHLSFETSKQHALFGEYSFNRTLERMKSVSNTLMNNRPLQKANASDFQILFDGTMINNELRQLREEIKVLSGGTGIDKKDAKKKQDKFDTLEKYADTAEEYIKAEKEYHKNTTEENRKKLEIATVENEKAYSDYVHVLAKNADGEHVSLQGLKESYIQIKDYWSLKNDSERMGRAVNILHNPEHFMKYAERRAVTDGKIAEMRAEVLFESYVKYGQDEQINDLLNELYNLGLRIPEETTREFIEGNVPFAEFFDVAMKEKITFTSNKDLFEKGNAIVAAWRKYQEEVNKKKEESVEPVVPVEPVKNVVPVAGLEMITTDNSESDIKKNHPELFANLNIVFSKKKKDLEVINKANGEHGELTWKAFMGFSEAQNIVEKYNKETGRVEKPKQKASVSTPKSKVKAWKKLISDSLSERELDAVSDKIDKANESSPELTDEIAKKRASFPKKNNTTTSASTELQAKKADIERRRQAELNELGQKQIKNNFERLNEDRNKSPKAQLTLINSIEAAQKHGVKLTKEQQAKVNSIKEELKKQGYEIVDINNTVLHEGTKVINEVVQASDENTILNEEQIKAVEKELERRSKTEAKLRKIGASEEHIKRELEIQAEEPINVVDRIIKPQVTKDNKLEQAAEVSTIIIEANEAQALVDKSKAAKKGNHSDKINAKYDAELAALETKKIDVERLKQTPEGQKIEVNRKEDLERAKNHNYKKGDSADYLANYKQEIQYLQHKLDFVLQQLNGPRRDVNSELPFGIYPSQVESLEKEKEELSDKIKKIKDTWEKIDKQNESEINTKYNAELAELEKGTTSALPVFTAVAPQIIYATSGTGKTTMSKQYSNVKDGDEILFDWMNNKGIPTTTIQDSGLDFVKYYKANLSEKDKLVKEIQDKFKEVAKTNIVLTSNWFSRPIADKVYLSKDATKMEDVFIDRGDKNAKKSAEDIVFGNKKEGTKSEQEKFEELGKKFEVIPTGFSIEQVLLGEGPKPPSGLEQRILNAKSKEEIDAIEQEITEIQSMLGKEKLSKKQKDLLDESTSLPPDIMKTALIRLAKKIQHSEIGVGMKLLMANNSIATVVAVDDSKGISVDIIYKSEKINKETELKETKETRNNQYIYTENIERDIIGRIGKDLIFPVQDNKIEKEDVEKSNENNKNSELPSKEERIKVSEESKTTPIKKTDDDFFNNINECIK